MDSVSCFKTFLRSIKRAKVREAMVGGFHTLTNRTAEWKSAHAISPLTKSRSLCVIECVLLGALHARYYKQPASLAFGVPDCHESFIITSLYFSGKEATFKQCFICIVNLDCACYNKSFFNISHLFTHFKSCWPLNSTCKNWWHCASWWTYILVTGGELLCWIGFLYLALYVGLFPPEDNFCS